MKSKKKISSNQIAETQIIEKITTPERNGIINPAFLSTPTSEEQVPDYRSHQFGQNWSHNHNNGIETQASSWVYNFNQMDSPESMTLATHQPFEVHPENTLQHMNYSMDLNKDHKRHESLCSSRNCCQTFLRLFIWSIIVVSLLGIAISVAFIIYIEKFANCDDTDVKSANITKNTNTFDDRNVTIPSSLFNTSNSYNTTTKKLPTDEDVDNSISTNVTTKLHDILMSTQMPNISTLNLTEIPVNEENETVINSTITTITKSFFYSSEETNVGSTNTTVILSNNTSSDNFTTSNNNTFIDSSLSSSSTTALRTGIATPIELASNDSLNNDNNTAVNELNVTTEIVLSSSSLSSNIMSDQNSDFNANTNQSENPINHSLGTNVANSTSINGLENIFTIDKTINSSTHFTRQ